MGIQNQIYKKVMCYILLSLKSKVTFETKLRAKMDFGNCFFLQVSHPYQGSVPKMHWCEHICMQLKVNLSIFIIPSFVVLCILNSFHLRVKLLTNYIF